MVDDSPLDESRLRDLCSQLEAAGRKARLPPDQIVEIWTATVERVSHVVSSQSEAWSQALGLSKEGLSSGLDVMLRGANREVAEGLAQRVDREHDRRGTGPFLKVVLLTPSPPLLAVQALLPALIAGSPLLIKVSSREPSLDGRTLTELLVETLSDRSPELGRTVATVQFPGGTRESADLEAVLFEQAERLVAYGGSEAISSLERRFANNGIGQLITHGPKLSLALIDRSALEDDQERLELARKLARDISLFDQRGCLSLHWIFTDADPAPLTRALEHQLSLMADLMPAGTAMVRDFPAIQSARALTAMRPESSATTGPVERGTVLATKLPTAPTEGSLEPSPGGRTVRLYQVPDFTDLAWWRQRLEPWKGLLQGLALESGVSDEAPFRLLARQLGVSYVCSPGKLQEVPADWPNGGHDPLVVYGRGGYQ